MDWSTGSKAADKSKELVKVISLRVSLKHARNDRKRLQGRNRCPAFAHKVKNNARKVES